MKTKLIIALILAPLVGISQQSRGVRIDSSLVTNSDLVALVRVHDVSEKIYAEIRMLFKGACVMENEIAISQNDFVGNLSSNIEYLLFAKTDSDCLHFFDKKSKLIEKGEGEEYLNFLLNILPCIDIKEKERYKEVACHRDFSPVCGCDGIVYGNFCEAKKAGIQILKKGRCN